VVRSDETWVQQLQASDGPQHRAALADLRDYLRATLARGFGHQLSGEDLEDVTQESLLRVHRKLDGFEAQSRFTTWAAAIAVNGALSALRRNRYRHVSLEDAAAQAAAALAEEADSPAPDEELLHRAIAEALTDRQREALLAKLAGVPLMEVARRLGTTQGAIYKLLHDARRRIKRYIEAAEPDTIGRMTARGGT
jgi:RNA polymerase sigma-70 factor (ECF subfamily)